MKYIIALSGRKSAGKNTVARSLAYWFENDFSYDDRHRVVECSFADHVKRFCIDVLGLTEEQCNGTDDQKNSLTEYKWSQCSPYLAWKFGDRNMVDTFHASPDARLSDMNFKHESDPERLRKVFYNDSPYSPKGQRVGFMTARDVMQIYGTDLIRETFGNVWAKATIRTLKSMPHSLGLITDNRFPSEIDTVLAEEKGFIIRLTRSPYGTKDNHPSEAALDGYDWNKPKCFVFDNNGLTLEEQHSSARSFLEQILRS